jgi:hypothetical protein
MVHIDHEEAELDARIAAAEKRLEVKKSGRDRELKKRRAAVLEARAKYTEELGAEGEAFAVIDAGAEGPIVVKPGLMVLYKAYRARVMKDDMTLEAAQHYILPCTVFPERDVLLEVLNRRPALHDDLVVALHKLHGANEALDRGKA